MRQLGSRMQCDERPEGVHASRIELSLTFSQSTIVQQSTGASSDALLKRAMPIFPNLPSTSNATRSARL